MKNLNHHSISTKKRPKKEEFPRYTLRLTKPLALEMDGLGRIEKRHLPDLVRGCIDKAIAELKRKRQTTDQRRIKIV